MYSVVINREKQSSFIVELTFCDTCQLFLFSFYCTCLLCGCVLISCPGHNFYYAVKDFQITCRSCPAWWDDNGCVPHRSLADRWTII